MFNKISVRILANLFVSIDKLKFMWREKRFRIANSLWKDKNKAGEVTGPDFKTYVRATRIRTMCIGKTTNR
jgi:hypothetical protein